MSIEGKAGTKGSEGQEDEALWDLLGRHESPVKVGPYFARRVLREVALAEGGGGWAQRARRFWLAASRPAAVWSGALAFGLLCLSAVVTLPSGRRPMVPASTAQTAVEPAAPAASTDDPAPVPEQESERVADASSVQDEEVIADLDNLLSREESRLWTEDTDTARF